MSRQFREVLKMAKPELTDAIVKLPRSAQNKEMQKTKQTMRSEDILLARPLLIMTRGEGEERGTRWEA